MTKVHNLSITKILIGSVIVAAVALFGFLALTQIAKAQADEIISTVVGTGTSGFSGDGGPATSAQLSGPKGTAFDAAGNLYIADGYNNRIRMVNTAGVITTFVGTGAAGFSGDGGPATSAQLRNPQGVAFDAAGNLYIADFINHRIRKVDTSGIITTFAGGATSFGGFSGDNGPATSAQLNGPQGVALDAAGNLYIADTSNNRIRMVNTAGIITTFVGTTGGFSGDNGPATSAQLKYPTGIGFDAAGNLYIADTNNNRIRRVDTSGIITTFAGTTFAGFSGDGGPATSAQLRNPQGVALDAAGNLLIADFSNHRIRMVNAAGIISTFVGTGVAGFSGDGGPATSAQLRNPQGVALDAAGNLYIADLSNHRIRKVTAPPLTPIYNCSELQDMNLDLSGNYQLMNDIDCSDTINWNADAGFDPIGGTFTGSFRGNNYTIRGLFIDLPFTDHVGFFGQTSGADIDGLWLKDVNITGRNNVGSFAGGMWDSSFSNSFATGDVTGAYQIGGFFGFQANGILSDSYFDGNVTGTSSSAGGAIGYNFEGNISNSFTASNVTAPIGGGGFIGENDGGTYASNFWDIERAGSALSDTGSVNISGISGITTSAITTETTFTSAGWDFTLNTGDWKIVQNGSNSYPCLQGQNNANCVFPPPPAPSCMPVPSSVKGSMVQWLSADNTPNDLLYNDPGRIVGGTTYVPGKFGEAFYFDSTDGTIDKVPTSRNWGGKEMSEGFTIGFWVKPDEDTRIDLPRWKGGNQYVAVVGDGLQYVLSNDWGPRAWNNARDLAIAITAGKNAIGVYTHGNGWAPNELMYTAPSDNLMTDWTYITVVTGPGKVGTPESFTEGKFVFKIYRDGVLVESTDPDGDGFHVWGEPNVIRLTPMPTNAGATSGMENSSAFGGSTEGRYKGALDEPMAFSRPLTAAEVSELYNAQSGTIPLCKPTTPQPLTPTNLNVVINGPNSATFTWDDPNIGGSDGYEFYLYRNAHRPDTPHYGMTNYGFLAFDWFASPATTSFTINNLPSNEIIKFKVKAVKNEVRSSLSAQAGGEITPLPPQDQIFHLPLDEGAGLTAFDLSGNGNDGGLKDGPIWTSGKIGNALDFDGNDDWIEISASNSLGTGGQLTIQAWVNPDILNNYSGVVSKNVEGGGAGYTVLTVIHGDGSFGVYSPYTGWRFSPAGLISTGVWTNVAWVLDGSTVTFYKNGVAVGSTSMVIRDIPDHTWKLARWYSLDNTYMFNGKIDEAMVYNYARTPAQILEESQRVLPFTFSIITTSFPPNVINVFSEHIIEVNHGTPPYTCEVTTGNVPPGMSLSSGCVLSGTPTTEGTYGFTVVAKDFEGNTDDQVLEKNIILEPVATPIWAVNTSGSVQMSFDGGDTWQSKTNIGTGGTWWEISIDSTAGKVWAISIPGSVKTSVDGGITWQSKTRAGYGTWYGIAVDSTTGKAYAVNTDGVVRVSSNGGDTWVSKTSVGSGRLWNEIVVNSTTGEVLVLDYYGAVKASSNGGDTWVSKTSVGRGNWGMSVNSMTGDIWVLNSSGATKKSIDGGITWQAKTSLASPNWTAISIEPTTGKVLVLDYYGNVKTSSNDGGTWELNTSLESVNWRGLSVGSTPPTIEITDPIPTITNVDGTVTYTVGYEGATTITLSPGDITPHATDTASCDIPVVASAGNTRTVEFSNCTGDGFYGFDIKPGTAVSATGVFAVGASSGDFTVDNTPPTVIISSSASDPTGVSPIPIEVTFSEEVTGFLGTGIMVGNGTAGDFVAVNGSTYTFDITPTADGPVTVDIPAGAAQDAAGNENEAASPLSITYDSTLIPFIDDDGDGLTDSLDAHPNTDGTLCINDSAVSSDTACIVVDGVAQTITISTNTTGDTFTVVPSSDNTAIIVTTEADNTGVVAVISGHALDLVFSLGSGVRAEFNKKALFLAADGAVIAEVLLNGESKKRRRGEVTFKFDATDRPEVHIKSTGVAPLTTTFFDRDDPTLYLSTNMCAGCSVILRNPAANTFEVKKLSSSCCPGFIQRGELMASFIMKGIGRARFTYSSSLDEFTMDRLAGSDLMKLDGVPLGTTVGAFQKAKSFLPAAKAIFRGALNTVGSLGASFVNVEPTVVTGATSAEFTMTMLPDSGAAFRNEFLGSATFANSNSAKSIVVSAKRKSATAEFPEGQLDYTVKAATGLAYRPQVRFSTFNEGDSVTSAVNSIDLSDDINISTSLTGKNYNSYKSNYSIAPSGNEDLSVMAQTFAKDEPDAYILIRDGKEDVYWLSEYTPAGPIYFSMARRELMSEEKLKASGALSLDKYRATKPLLFTFGEIDYFLGDSFTNRPGNETLYFIAHDPLVSGTDAVVIPHDLPGSTSISFISKNAITGWPLEFQNGNYKPADEVNMNGVDTLLRVALNNGVPSLMVAQDLVYNTRRNELEACTQCVLPAQERRNLSFSATAITASNGRDSVTIKIEGHADERGVITVVAASDGHERLRSVPGANASITHSQDTFGHEVTLLGEGTFTAANYTLLADFSNRDGGTKRVGYGNSGLITGMTNTPLAGKFASIDTTYRDKATGFVEPDYAARIMGSTAGQSIDVEVTEDQATNAVTFTNNGAALGLTPVVRGIEVVDMRLPGAAQMEVLVRSGANGVQMEFRDVTGTGKYAKLALPSDQEVLIPWNIDDIFVVAAERVPLASVRLKVFSSSNTTAAGGFEAELMKDKDASRVLNARIKKDTSLFRIAKNSTTAASYDVTARYQETTIHTAKRDTFETLANLPSGSTEVLKVSTIDATTTFTKDITRLESVSYASASDLLLIDPENTAFVLYDGSGSNIYHIIVDDSAVNLMQNILLAGGSTATVESFTFDVNQAEQTVHYLYDMPNVGDVALFDISALRKDTDGDDIIDFFDTCPNTPGYPGVYGGCDAAVEMAARGHYNDKEPGVRGPASPSREHPLPGVFMTLYDATNVPAVSNCLNLKKQPDIAGCLLSLPASQTLASCITNDEGGNKGSCTVPAPAGIIAAAAGLDGSVEMLLASETQTSQKFDSSNTLTDGVDGFINKFVAHIVHMKTIVERPPRHDPPRLYICHRCGQSGLVCGSPGEKNFFTGKPSLACPSIRLPGPPRFIPACRIERAAIHAPICGLRENVAPLSIYDIPLTQSEKDGLVASGDLPASEAGDYLFRIGSNHDAPNCDPSAQTCSTKAIWTAQRKITGSELNIYEPMVIDIQEGIVEVPFVYQTEDDYWKIVTNFAPPTGCTVEVPEISTTVDHSEMAAIFTLTCSSDATAEISSTSLSAGAHNAFVSAIKDAAAQARYSIEDCTRTPCKRTSAVAKIAVRKARPAPKALEKAPPFQVQDGAGGVTSLWGLIKSLINGGSTNASVANTVVEVAEENDVGIPEWGVSGTYDSRTLSPSFLQNLNLNSMFR